MGWWGKSEAPKAEPEPQQEAPPKDPSPKEPFDPKLPPAQKLPKGLQKIVDKSDQDGSFFDGLSEG